MIVQKAAPPDQQPETFAFSTREPGKGEGRYRALPRGARSQRDHAALRSGATAERWLAADCRNELRRRHDWCFTDARLRSRDLLLDVQSCTDR